jgi:hypothetical protein
VARRVLVRARGRRRGLDGNVKNGCENSSVEGGHGLESQGQVSGCCEDGNEPLTSCAAVIGQEGFCFLQSVGSVCKSPADSLLLSAALYQ